MVANGRESEENPQQSLVNRWLQLLEPEINILKGAPESIKTIVIFSSPKL